MRTCINCGKPNIGDGRMYPGCPVLPLQPSGVVCVECEQDLLHEQRDMLRKLYAEECILTPAAKEECVRLGIRLFNRRGVSVTA